MKIEAIQHHCSQDERRKMGESGRLSKGTGHIHGISLRIADAEGAPRRETRAHFQVQDAERCGKRGRKVTRD
jgi:hypothetical protein